MLNPFPIQFLALLAYALLRICVGGILAYRATSHLREKRTLVQAFGALELVSGLMLIVGYYTQIAALLSGGVALLALSVHAVRSALSMGGRQFYLLLFVASLSLFITGAGFFAFDLPI